jgi:hypothetical protein
MLACAHCGVHLPRDGSLVRRRRAQLLRRRASPCRAALRLGLQCRRSHRRSRAAAGNAPEGRTQAVDRRAGLIRRTAGAWRPTSPWFGSSASIPTRAERRVGSSTLDGWLPARPVPTAACRDAARPAGVAPQDNALARIYRTYAAARAVVGLVLVAAAGRLAVCWACGWCWRRRCCASVYAVQAITFWLLPRFRVLSGPRRARRRDACNGRPPSVSIWSVVRRLASARVGFQLQLCGPAGAAGPDGRCADQPAARRWRPRQASP